MSRPSLRAISLVGIRNGGERHGSRRHLIVRALLALYQFYGENFKIECPTGSGHMMNLYEVAREISNRLIRIFRQNKEGLRPVFGGSQKFQTDSHWRNYILCYENFHGDSGAGIGASHQTGWTGLVARLIEFFAEAQADQVLESDVAGFQVQDDEPQRVASPGRKYSVGSA